MFVRTAHHLRTLLPLALVLAIVVGVAWTGSRPFLSSAPGPTIPVEADLDAAVAQVDKWFAERWSAAEIQPAAQADDLLVFRRLSLALVGAVPSLEEIREFEADQGPDRLRRWTSQLIADSRFVEYFPMRLVDGLVDPMASAVEHRHRQRFARWLGDQIQQGEPYDQVVHQLVAGRGLWGDHPGTTFVAAELRSGEQSAERLAARTARFFLGQRIDCAQCHDHPFADWTQPQFEGLAAYFGNVESTAFGVQDTRSGPLRIEDTHNQERREVEPLVPFNEQVAPREGHVREQLAAWLTHGDNDRFRRAVANRIWGLMFGRPFVSPVDDIPDPPPSGQTDETFVLDLLGDDLANHGYDLRRMILVIAASRPFRRESSHPQLDQPETGRQLEDAWAVFPMTHLRPLQLVRSMQQAASIRTLRADESGTWASFGRYERIHRFLEQYGTAADADDDEMASTIPQTVQRLVGQFTRENSEASILTAPGRIATLSGDDTACLDNCYLACLTRRATAAEQSHFLAQFGKFGLNRRANTVEDIYWTLFNSAEFCWSH